MNSALFGVSRCYTKDCSHIATFFARKKRRKTGVRQKNGAHVRYIERLPLLYLPTDNIPLYLPRLTAGGDKVNELSKIHVDTRIPRGDNPRPPIQPFPCFSENQSGTAACGPQVRSCRHDCHETTFAELPPPCDCDRLDRHRRSCRWRPEPIDGGVSRSNQFPVRAVGARSVDGKHRPMDSRPADGVRRTNPSA
jgi:hypothetical protein